MDHRRSVWIAVAAVLLAYGLGAPFLLYVGSLAVPAGRVVVWWPNPWIVAAIAAVVLSVVLFSLVLWWRPLGSAPQAQAAPATAQPATQTSTARPGVPGITSAGYAPTLVTASGTNETPFPRIESASDSLGHTATRTSFGLQAHSDYVLRPGRSVTFYVTASDPNGDDVELSIITPGGRNADVTITPNGAITWNVREEDIADPAHVSIYMAGQRSYHRVSQSYDEAVSFTYRVLPRA